METAKRPLTEKNWFDDLLKENLFRDIVFRAAVLTLITLATLYFAKQRADFSSVSYLVGMVNIVGPVLNTVGVLALFLAILALAFKDLEHFGGRWDQATRLGKTGSVIRRLASDLMLWMMGVFCSLLIAVLLVSYDVARTSAIHLSDIPKITYLYFLFIVGPAVSAYLNVAIRAPNPLLLGHPTSAAIASTPLRTFVLYLAIFIIWVSFASLLQTELTR